MQFLPAIPRISMRFLVTLLLFCALARTQGTPSFSRLPKLTDREYADLAQIAYFQIAASPGGSPGGGMVIIGGHPFGLTPEGTGTLYRMFQASQLPQLTAFSSGELYDVSKITAFRLPTATPFTNRWGEDIEVGGWATDPSVAAENYLRRIMGLPQASY